MKLYAVIDTNVLVSALLRWDSVPGAVLEQALVGSIKHFPLKPYVVTPREMLTILENGGKILPEEANSDG